VIDVLRFYTDRGSCVGGATKIRLKRATIE
jgi:hypothetical protein